MVPHANNNPMPINNSSILAFAVSVKILILADHIGILQVAIFCSCNLKKSELLIN
jgi:hypothetical protein